LVTGAAAGWVIPISMAYVGDVTPHDRLQQILGRYISGQILGQLFGQAAGGVLGDLLGWRNVFLVLAGLFAVAAAGLVFELAINPQTRKAGSRGGRGLFGGYAAGVGRLCLYPRPSASALRLELLTGRRRCRLFRYRRFDLRRAGEVACLSPGPSPSGSDRRACSRGRLPCACDGPGLVARPNRHDRDRAWLLHAA